MKILAVECSASSASASLSDGDKILASSFINVKLTHSQTLLPMIENLLAISLTDINDIEALAVSCGPGSFTGIRIGISAVKGLAAPKKLPCAGISTLLGMAYGYSDTDCILCAVMDARCNQVYNAVFDIQDGKITRLCKDRALMCDELEKEIKKLSQNAGKRVIITGDGTDIFYPYVKELAGVYPADGQRKYQRAEGVALAAAESFKSGEYTSPEALLPIYLRLPQAQRELKKKKEVKL